MAESIELSTILPASAERIYLAWLDGEKHSAMTGGDAKVDPAPGGSFSAWDGDIYGKTLEQEPYRRIVQSWRTTEFPAGSPDSLLEVLLEDQDPGQPGKEGTRIILKHTNIPDGQGQDYYQGWVDYYFEPMQAYFLEA